MFYDDLFFEIIKPIKKYFKFLNEQYPDFINYHINHTVTGNKKSINPAVIIPCNMSFCNSEEKIAKVQAITNEFKELNVNLFFSYSTDGIYSTDIREKQIIDNKFFDTVFALCEKNNWGVHPMISYEGIDKAIDNYNWFKKKFTQFKLNNGSSIPYYLEVRNDGWTEETLEKYQNFLLYHLNDIFHNYNKSNLHDLFENYFRSYKIVNKKYTHMGNSEGLGKLNILKDNSIPCGLSKLDLSINIGTLSFIPCHRLAYPELNGGKFIIENNHIIDIEPTEYYNAYFNLLFINNSLKPKCVSCFYNVICMKGCAGAQYEYFADPFFSIPSVCNMLQVKYNTILDFYHSIGLFHYIFKTEPLYPCNTSFKNLLLNRGYKEYIQYQQLGDF